MSRRENRVAMRWTVAVVIAGEAQIGETLDMSPRGLAILVPRPVRVGAHVEILLDRHDFPCLVDGPGVLSPIEGRVVYARPRARRGDGVHRIGVRVRAMAPSICRHLRAMAPEGMIRVT
jgi:hypothetical protein